MLSGAVGATTNSISTMFCVTTAHVRLRTTQIIQNSRLKHKNKPATQLATNRQANPPSNQRAPQLTTTPLLQCMRCTSSIKSNETKCRSVARETATRTELKCCAKL